MTLLSTVTRAAFLAVLLACIGRLTLAATSQPSSAPSSTDAGASGSTAVVLDVTQPLTRFTFGSCSQQDLPQPMWPIMQARAPQMFVWLGDVVSGRHAQRAMEAC
jgi:hypothetical protein